MMLTSLTSKRIINWSTHDVVEFSKSLRLFQYAKLWIENEITGDALVHLIHEDLEEMGIRSVGHRLRILKSVYNIKIAQKIPIEPDNFVPIGANRPPSIPSTPNTTDQSVLVTATELQQTVSAIQERDDKIHDLETQIQKLKEEMLPMFKMLKTEYHFENNYKTQLLPELPLLPQLSLLHLKELPEIPSSDLGSWAEDALQGIDRSGSREARKRDSRDSNESGESSKSSGSSGSHPNRLFRLPELEPPTDMGGVLSPDGSLTYDTPLREEFADLERYIAGGGDLEETWPPASITSSDDDYDEPAEELIQALPRSSTIKSPVIRDMENREPSMDERTYQVLPAALKQYGIEADWWDYELWVAYDGGERMFQEDEKPLVVFRELAKEGMEPMLKLRKKFLDSPLGLDDDEYNTNPSRRSYM
ncbi:hypothetical protein H072_11360 [Dactylellina haptotyla CBS 200.50]|uniref:Uncharacterized protein n=1 Tax=Dactylellina haptotyla (strain CBS 200.50) TaxID=1284197 RepID=S8A292_DACHA|nr:hypothetical protein H072_11360 [Dactylellina haptotyla CBS 200.50]